MYNIMDECGTGMYFLPGLSETIERNTVYRSGSTCPSGTTGLYLSSIGSTGCAVSNNLFHNLETGMDCGGSSMTYTHNIYSAGACTSGVSNDCSLSSTEIATKQAIFCLERESPVRKFTQRIDSEASKGNSGWNEVVGAEDVECAWGEIARNTTVASGTVVTVLEDLSVPSARTLTLSSGVQIRFDDDDNSATGSSSTKNELTVTGTLTVNGSSGSKVKFISAKASPAESDWYGINCLGAAGQSIDHAEVKHAVYGVRVRQDATSSVTNSTLSDNSGSDIYLSSTGTSDSTEASVADNTITVGGGYGIEMTGNLDGSIVEDNTVTCNSSTLAGIVYAPINDSHGPLILNNTVTGFTAGKGIEIQKGIPVLKKNKTNSGKYGIYVGAGNPRIGVASDTTSDNIGTGNSSAGLWVTGSSATGKVRQSRFTGNGSGIVTKGNSNPDLGTSGDYGKNIVIGNTNYCLWNQSTSGTVSAQGNYKDACDFSTCWNGSFDLTNSLCSVPSGGGWATEPVPVGPALAVMGVRPNPLTESTRVTFRTARPRSEVRLGVYDVGGRLVRGAVPRVVTAGEHQFSWDGLTDGGRPAANGLYFIQVRDDGGAVVTARVLVSR